jgi:hypothetical protein
MIVKNLETVILKIKNEEEWIKYLLTDKHSLKFRLKIGNAPHF